MAKEYRITTLRKKYSNGVSIRKDIGFCSNLEDALKYVDFNEQDLEYVNVLSYIQKSLTIVRLFILWFEID